MKLYVDDVRQIPDESWTLCRTISQAVRLLATQLDHIEVISLDFDAGYMRAPNLEALLQHKPCVSVTPFVVDEEKFDAIAWALSLIPEEQRPEVRVHSANPIARGVLGSIVKLDTVTRPKKEING